ncbi:hypothetical protein KFE25_007886 [Diacronema lutheri]|uniref:EF-hand domain-containing protein n=1 Tax=Diacronema lutheri TaxID=2081491 RepID=A0A8J6C9H1_DIALT|nr:hypothetical protein KFE25_007886 [Diacronema lutheri]
MAAEPDDAVVLTGQPAEEPRRNSRTAAFTMGGHGIADSFAESAPATAPPAPDNLEEKRAAAIAAREAARRERINAVKKSKFTKNLERKAAEEKAEAARKVEEARKAHLAEIEAKRQANILRKEAEHKAKADALRVRKLHAQRADFKQADVLLLHKAHALVDADKSGSVSIEQLKDALRASALPEGLVSSFDRNKKDGSVSLDEFLKLIYPRASAADFELMRSWIDEATAPPPPPPRRTLSPHELGEVHAIFSKYDDDKSGGLEIKELKAALKGKFAGVDDAQVDAMFAAADQDESATLDRDEFKALLVGSGLWDGEQR